MKRANNLPAAILIAGSAGATGAQTITWDGSCGSNGWFDCCGQPGPFDNNWDSPINQTECPRLPGTADFVDLGGAEVRYNIAVATTIAQITGTGHFAYVSGFPLTVLGNADFGTLEANGTTLTIGGDLTVAQEMNWGGTTLTVGQPSQVGGELIMEIGQGRTLAGSLTALQHADWFRGAISLSTGSTLTIEGLLTNRGDLAASGLGTLRLNGGFHKQDSTGRTTIGCPLECVGDVHVTSGTLRFSTGGFIDGTVTADAGAIVEFTQSGAPFEMKDGSSFFGKGLFRKTGGAALTVHGSPFSMPGFELHGTSAALLSVPAGSCEIEHFLWSEGTIEGPGTTRATTSVTIGGAGSLCRVANGTFISEGTCLWNGNVISLHTGGTFENAGAFTLAINDGAMTAASTSGPFINSGTFTKSIDTGRTQLRSVRFENRPGGSIDVQGGTLEVNLSGTLINAGSISLAADSSLVLNATLQCEAGGTVDGDGLVDLPNILGRIHVNGASTIRNLRMTDGRISGAGPLIISRLMDWHQGTMEGTGASASTTIASNAVLNLIEGGTGFRTLDGRNLEIFGTMNWDDSRTLFILENSRLINNGTFNHRKSGNIDFLTSEGQGEVVNNGRLNKAATDSLDSLSVNVPFHNDGVVNLESGVITLRAGGNSAGSFTIAPGHPLIFVGDAATAYEWKDGMTIDGEGAAFVGFNAADVFTVNVTGTVEASNLVLNGGTIDGLGDLRINNTLDWQGTILKGTGSTGGAVTNLGTATFAAATHEIRGRRFDNEGTATWTGGNVEITGNGVFNNNGRLDIRPAGDAAMRWLGDPGTLITNSGTFDKAEGLSETTMDIDFSNQGGAIIVRSGTLRFARNYSQVSGTLNLLGGSVIFDAPTTIVGGGITGSGADSKLVGNLNNQGGTLGPGQSPGRLILEGSFTQEAGGTLAVEIAGIVPETQHDVLAVTGDVTLGGTLAVSLLNGFQPKAGNRFTVVTATTVGGEFEQAIFPPLVDRRLKWSVEYAPDRVDVVVTTVRPGGEPTQIP